MTGGKQTGSPIRAAGQCVPDFLRRAALAVVFCAWPLGAVYAQSEGIALPETAPMPLERPLEAPARPGDNRPRPPHLIEIPAAEMKAGVEACKAFLARDIAVAEIAEPAMWSNGCGAAGQAKVSAIKLKNGKQVPLRPSALIRCETAAAIADWVREDLAPALEGYSGLDRIQVAASYHCRPRNNIRGALMSEHGRANALDIRYIFTSDGRRFGVDVPETPILLMNEMRRSTCARFTTVLGPGSDGYHEDHLHIDLAVRRNSGYRLCRWQLPVPPTPLPRPEG